jgi:hypothetical protein
LNELPFTEEFVHPYAEDAYRAILDSPEINELVVEQNWLDDKHFDGVLEKYCPDEESQDYLKKLKFRYALFL